MVGSSPGSPDGDDDLAGDHHEKKRQPGVKRACNECRQQKVSLRPRHTAFSLPACTDQLVPAVPNYFPSSSFSLPFLPNAVNAHRSHCAPLGNIIYHQLLTIGHHSPWN